MAISRMANGFYTFSDNHFKSMNKKDLIIYIRTIEKNWENSLITNDIQYNNCIKLLAEERNKTIDEIIRQLDAEVESSAKFIREYDDSIAQKAYHKALCNALDIVKRMKGEEYGRIRKDL